MTNMKTVLITGASSGIGRDIAIEFSKENFNFVLVSRRENLLVDLKNELLNNNPNISVDYFVCDLREEPKAVYDYCVNKKIDVDVLINNAGLGDFSDFVDEDIDKINNMIEVNNKALVDLSYYFVKDFIRKKDGCIINVGSVASFVSGPHMAVYYASKAFVLSFSLALRQELKNDGIKVMCLCPGNTKTSFWEVAGSENSEYNIFQRSSKDVAKTCIKLYKTNKPYMIDGLMYKLMIVFVRLLPMSFASKLIGYIQANLKEKK